MATQPTPKYRSAKSGQYVKPSYAKVHPNTTVKETVAKPAKVGKRG
ncbi:MAG TPA: multidrug transporter [Candidatus Saccharibacteria bacterium]|nr:multidrug transporter [Candidatus Saccharibacteria bacterium]